MTTTKEKIKLIREFDGRDVNQLNDFINYAKDLCDVVEKLDNDIKNTTHGRPRIMHKIRRLDDILIGDTMYNYATRKMYKVVENETVILYDNSIALDTANNFVKRGTGVRIPHIMHYGSGYNYRRITVGGKNCIVAIKERKKETHEEFFETISILVPELKNYVCISMSAIGNDEYGDRLNITLSYYKQEDSSTHYLSKNVRTSKKYRTHILHALEIYRQVNNRPEFLKNNPL